MPLTEDITIRVRHDFPADEVAPVVEMLGELQREDAQLFCDRILRCLVFVASGRFAALADAVALARTDYRDLIVAAESDRDWQQVRDFNGPFGHVD
jgi:hypothetical protein